MMRRLSLLLLPLLVAATAPAPSVPLRLAAQGSFYVGGRDVEQNGATLRVDSMYVEYRLPAKRTHATPVVLVHGNYQNGTAFTGTPDGREGWADMLLRRGYAVYIVDQPMRGRSPYHPAIDGPATTIPPAQMERLFTAPALTSPVRQTRKHTQWPGTGRVGDPVFEQLYTSQQPTVTGPGERIDAVVRAALGALLRKIGPAVILTHSRAGTFGWEVADDAPDLVRAVVAIEPNGPPFYDPASADSKTPEKMARRWGPTYDRLTYAPAVADPAELRIARQSVAEAPDLLPCWLQTGTPRRLSRLARTPVMIVVGEASYHAPYDHCTARYLTQAGVPVRFVRLEDQGIHGNGHLMMLEKNNGKIATLIADWLDRTVR